MARPRHHDGRLFRKEESKFWWRTIATAMASARGNQQNPGMGRSTEAVGERLQARDSNTLPLLRKGGQITFAQWSERFLQAFAKQPMRAQKSHLS